MNENFSVGTVLGRGIGTYFKNIIPFTLIVAVVYLPMIIWTYVVFSNNSLTIEQIQSWTLKEYVFKLVLSSFAVATLTFGVVKELQGERASIGTCIANGISRSLPALGVGLMTALAVVGGAILLVVPGIIAACMLYVAMPASVIEKPGVFGALRRSRELTDGYKGSIFGVLFLFGLANWVAGQIVVHVMAPTTLPQLRTLAIVIVAIDVVLAGIGACVAAVAYYLLRAEKEGTSAHELASVFE